MSKNIFFIVFAILSSIFVIAFGMTTYRYYQAIHSDDPIDPYLSVEKGQATIARGDIAIDMTTSETYNIREGDVIITRADSLAVILWPDHSTTRLGANSRLTIERMRVADDYSQIELVALLENGKAWSNIVRTLYPNSRVEFRLPKSGTVVGVRGTVFEINLDNNYIHSVEHSVTLDGGFLKGIVMLMPGEAVLATDILQKITTQLDTAWISVNEIKDAAYTAIRDTQLRATYSILTGQSKILDIWDRFVRWILSWFSAFRDIDIITAMSSGDISYLKTISQDAIMKWYQTFQSKDFIQERDQIRGSIMSVVSGFTGRDQIMDILTRGSMWDMSSATGFTLQNAHSLLGDYAKKTGTTLDKILLNIKQIGSGTINTDARALYNKLFQ